MRGWNILGALPTCSVFQVAKGGWGFRWEWLAGYYGGHSTNNDKVCHYNHFLHQFVGIGSPNLSHQKCPSICSAKAPRKEREEREHWDYRGCSHPYMGPGGATPPPRSGVCCCDRIIRTS